LNSGTLPCRLRHDFPSAARLIHWAAGPLGHEASLATIGMELACADHGGLGSFLLSTTTVGEYSDSTLPVYLVVFAVFLVVDFRLMLAVSAGLVRFPF